MEDNNYIYLTCKSMKRHRFNLVTSEFETSTQSGVGKWKTIEPTSKLIAELFGKITITPNLNKGEPV